MVFTQSPVIPVPIGLRTPARQGTGTLTRGRRSRRVKIVELDAIDAAPVLRSFAVEVPVGVGFAERSGLVREGTPNEFASLAGELAVFRFDPQD